MKDKPIEISPELAAKYDQADQFERFDEAFKKVIQIPAHETPAPEPKPKKPSGRPKKG